MRVPDHPPMPVPALLTLGDYVDAGIQVRSICSSGRGHSHVVDLEALAAERGRDTPFDYAFKISLGCPECGSPGGGVEIRRPD